MEPQIKSSDEAIGILEGIRETYDQVALDMSQLRTLGNLLEVADYEQIGGLTDKEFGHALNAIIERILDGLEKQLKSVHSGSHRVQEIIEQAEGRKRRIPETPKG